jgi:hypothetical protein
MREFCAARIVAALFSVFILSLLPGCSGTNAASTNAVTKIVLAPTSLSLNPGQVVQITATPQSSDGTTVVADVSFSSSNANLVTVSASGFVCGGTWDTNYITCNALPGQSAVGQATITATSGSITSTAPVYTHIQADRVIVDPIPGCVSINTTPTYAATVFNTSAAGCSTVSPCDITSTVGPVTFTSTDFQVMSNNVSTGVLTATSPGSTGIFATVSGLNSVPQPALVCPVASIHIHDANGSGTSFTLSTGGTQALTADVIDTNGVAITPILSWGSNPLGSATVALASGTNNATITSVAPGTAIITATCSTPDCNRNVGAQYGQNLVTVNTSGGSSTTVYAASTNSLTLVPIATSTNTPGTAITLPYLPNSMVSDSAGAKLYLGSSSALMIVDTATGTVTTSSIAGTVVAISPAGQYLLISNTPGGVVYFYNISASSVILSQVGTSTSAAFTPDSKSVSFVLGQQLYQYTTAPTTNVTSLPYLPNAVDVSAQGGLMYVTGSAAGAIDVRSTCTIGEWQTLTGTSPTLIAHLPNGTGAVAADSPSIDVVTTGTVQAGCPATAQSTVNTYNLGAGSFNARQLFLSSDSLRAWIISDLTSVNGFNLSTLTSTAIPLANAAQAYSGGVTLDGSKVYVGASDNNVHVLDVASGSDAFLIAPGLKDSSSNVVAPNLVVVLPH